MTFAINFDALSDTGRTREERDRAEFQRIVERLQGDSALREALSAHTGENIDVATPEGIAAFARLLDGLGTRYRAQDKADAAIYADVGAVLDGNVERITATLAARTDGQGLIYEGKVNTLFGDPEAGKSLVAVAMCVQVLNDGGRVLWVDLDHNGVSETVSRFVAFGAPASALRDPERFRFLDNPDDETDVLRAVENAREWKPTIAVVDSMGELIPLFGGNSDSADDYTSINRRVNAALADTGAAVVAIDHLAKGEGSRQYGAGGTMAKKRAANGSYLRVENIKPFAPGQGGRSVLKIAKDRPGDVRANSPRAGKAPEAATFDLSADGAFRFWAPGPGAPTDPGEATEDPRFRIMEEMEDLSIRKVKDRFSIGYDKARDLLEAFNNRGPF